MKLSVMCLVVIHVSLSCAFHSSPRFTHRNTHTIDMVATATPPTDPGEISGKTITKEIMSFFGERKENILADTNIRNRLLTQEVVEKLDGMHMITLLFQSARARRRVKAFIPLDLMLTKLTEWDKEWSERDISTFLYGINSLECIDEIDGKLLKLAALKIRQSNASLSSRSIGNALYGLQGITTDTIGAPELCDALADKVALFVGDLNGQDIGIGIYGLQVPFLLYFFIFVYMIFYAALLHYVIIST